jgi:hypothetical protein
MTSQEKRERIAEILKYFLHCQLPDREGIEMLSLERATDQILALDTPTMSEENSPELCWDKSHNRTYQKCSDCNKPIADYFVKALSGKIAKPDKKDPPFTTKQDCKTCQWQGMYCVEGECYYTPKPEPKECEHEWEYCIKGLKDLLWNCKRCGKEVGINKPSKPPKIEPLRVCWDTTDLKQIRVAMAEFGKKLNEVIERGNAAP